MKRIFRSIAIAAFLYPSASFAQDIVDPANTPKEKTAFQGDYLIVGAGVAYGPSYDGSNDAVAFPVGAVAGRVGSIGFAPRPAGVAINIIPVPQDEKVTLQFGPVIRARFDRHANIHDPVVAALGKRNIAVELGGNVGFTINRITNRYDSLSFSIDTRWDVADAYKGNVISPSVSYITPLNKGLAVVASASAEHVDNNYAHYYFDVTPQGSAASGLPAFVAKGNWKSVSGLLMTAIDLDGNLANGGFQLLVGGGYSRILGNFRRSPIVADRGEPDQWTGAVGVAYTF